MVDDATPDHPANPAQRQRIPEGELSSELAGLVGEHPALFLFGGFALGLAVGALLPRSASHSIVRRAAAIAAGAGEAATLLGTLALDRADLAPRDSRARLSESAGKAGRRALEAARDTRDAGASVIRKAARGIRGVGS